MFGHKFCMRLRTSRIIIYSIVTTTIFLIAAAGSGAAVFSLSNELKADKTRRTTCVAVPSGLISWWPGEGNAADIFGSNSGTLVGAAAFAPGKTGQAFSFDGSSAVVDVPDNATLDVTTSFTLAAWIKPSVMPVYPNAELVMSKVGGTNNLNGYQMAAANIDGTNKIWCGFNEGGNIWPQHTAVGGSIPVGAWSYIACTYDHNMLAVYQDGQLVGSTTIGPVTVANTSSHFKLGSDDVGLQFYSGLIDEPMIFDRALSGAELSSIYDAGGNVCVPTCTAPPSGMVGWWPGDGNADDIQGPTFENAVLRGNATYSSGKVQQAFSFDGSQGSFAEIPDSPSLNPTNAFTVDGWFYIDPFAPRGANDVGTLVGKSNGELNSYWSIYFDDRDNTKTLRFVMGSNVFYVNAIPTAGWYHVAGTFDSASSPRAKLYLNGNLVADSGSEAFNVTPNNLSLRIGAMHWSETFGVGNDRLNGRADEVQLFNRALSQAEIQTIYNAGSGGNCPTARAPTLFDYDGDGKTDISIFRPAVGAWYLQRSTDGLYGTLFGYGNDRITPADYNGDGKTDMAVYRPSTGIWYITTALSGRVSYYVFGLAEDLPTPADYDGDGKADVSVFRPSTGTWYRQNSSDGSFYGVQFGASEDKPTIGDFDGDGKADIAVFRPSTGAWYRINSGNGSIFGELFGFGSDILAPADYDGDGKTDLAVYRPSTGIWYLKYSSTSSYDYKVFGLADDIPAPGDFDGDGKADINVFRPSDGTWYRQNSLDGGFAAFQFGTNGDKPTMTAFRY